MVEADSLGRGVAEAWIVERTVMQRIFLRTGS